ncbi:VOC family protein [Novosphingobium umbonatum]|nr:VOC family protein [Novosphingobium umbonatum]
MTKLQGAWIWYELMTSDAAGAKAFYEAVAGWQIPLSGQAPLYYSHITRADGREVGGLLPLTQEMIAQGAHPAWVGYIGVDDINATLDAALAAGGRLLMPRMDIDEGSFAMVTDPGGAPFYLMQPRAMGSGQTSVSFSVEDCGSMGWNELPAADMARDLAFYQALFGWEVTGALDMGAYGQYQFLAHDGVTMGAIMQRIPEAQGFGWNHYIRVADIDAAASAINAHGGRVLRGPDPVPGEDWIIHGRDPQGASFALVGKRVA